MEESTSLAPAAASEAVAPVVTETAPHFQSAVTADMLPYVAPTETKEAPKEKPPTLINGKTNPQYLDWIAAQLPQEAKEDEPEPVPASLKGYGSIEEIKATLDLANGLYDKSNGVVDALDQIYERDQETYQKIVSTVIGLNPAYAVAQLQALNYLPQFVEAQAQALPADLRAVIPDELRETASTQSPNLLRFWAEQGTLQSQLEQQKGINELWAQQRAKSDAQWQASVKAAQDEGLGQLQRLSDMYANAHFAQLAKWKPTADEAANQEIRVMAYASALMQLLHDPAYAQMRTQIEILTAAAPMLRLKGQGFQADIDERDARSMATRVSTRLGQLVKARVQLLSPHLKELAKPKPEAKPDPKPPTLIPGTMKTNPAYLAWVARNPDGEKNPKAVITQEEL